MSISATARREALIRLLEDPVEDVRLAASAALEKLESASALDEVLAQLKTGTMAAKIRAIFALAEIGGERVMPALSYCASRPEAELRVAAIDALGKVNLPAAVPLLVERLQDAEPALRAKAVESLGNYRDPSLVKILTPFLGAGDGLVDAEAARALGKIGDASLEPRFIALLDSPFAGTREAAAQALSRLPLS